MRNILILCTGNSCRSILGKALINHLAKGRFKAFSAGSHPTGKVNPNALATLARNGLPAEGFTSQSWDDFDGAGIDIAITVCDQAVGRNLSRLSQQCTIKAHWGLPDPAHATDTDEDIARAFQATYDALSTRIHKMLALPLETMPGADITKALNTIGNQS